MLEAASLKPPVRRVVDITPFYISSNGIDYHTE
jgi:hypothetical protein